MARIDDLRADYDELERKLHEAEGSAAAAIVRERRLISKELEQLERPQEVALVDQLAKRRAKSGARRASTRRRQSG